MGTRVPLHSISFPSSFEIAVLASAGHDAYRKAQDGRSVRPEDST